MNTPIQKTKHDHDPIDPEVFPRLHAYLKTQAMLPWADKLAHIAMLVHNDIDEIDEKENNEALVAYRISKE